MIPSVTEIKQNLGSTFPFMRFDKSGLVNIGISDSLFWKSFFAAVLCYPGAYFLSTETPATLDPFAVLLIDTLFYLISWLIYPVFMHALLVLHNRVDNYKLFVISLNWLQVWQIVVLIGLHILTNSGLFAPATTGFIGLAGMLYLLATQTYMTKVTIDTNWFSAGAFVFFNILLSLSIHQLNNSILAG